jgi:hypothetical protein
MSSARARRDLTPSPRPAPRAQVCKAINERRRSDLLPADLFQFSTIRQLAARVDANTPRGPVRRTASVPAFHMLETRHTSPQPHHEDASPSPHALPSSPAQVCVHPTNSEFHARNPFNLNFF